MKIKRAVAGMAAVLAVCAAAGRDYPYPAASGIWGDAKSVGAEVMAHKPEKLARPGGFLIAWTNGFPVVTGSSSKDKNRLIAAAAGCEVGGGRVFVFGSEGFLNAEAAERADDAGFLVRALRWLGTGDAGSGAEVRAYVVPGLEAPALTNLEGVAKEELAGGLSAAGGLPAGSVCAVNADGLGEPTEGECAAVREFLSKGGGLLCVATASEWGRKNGWRAVRGHPLNLLMGAVAGDAGVYLAPGELSWPKAGKGYENAPAGRQSAMRLSDVLDELEGGTGDWNEWSGGKLTDKARKAGEKALFALNAAMDVLPEGALRGRAAAAADLHRSRVPTPAAPLRQCDVRERFSYIRFQEEWMKNVWSNWPAHPAASTYPGLPAAGSGRVTERVRFDLSVPKWHGTGLFAGAGEAVTFRLPAAVTQMRGWNGNKTKKDVPAKIRIGSTHENLTGKDVWLRAPKVDLEVDAVQGEMTVTSPFGGLIYLVVPEGGETNGVEVEAEIGPVCRAPRYKMGEDAPGEWRASLRGLPAPFAELDAGPVVFSVPSSAVREMDEPDRILEVWKRVLDLDAELAAFPGGPAGRRYPERIVADVQITAGAMHAGYPVMLTMKELPKLLSPEVMLSGINVWGYFHEVGHNHQRNCWVFEGTKEVSVNLFSLYDLEFLCGILPRETRQMGGEGHYQAMQEWEDSGRDYKHWRSNSGVALEFFLQIQERYGWEAFREVFADYWASPAEEMPKNDLEKRVQWAERLSRVTGEDLFPMFRDWNILEREEEPGMLRWDACGGVWNRDAGNDVWRDASGVRAAFSTNSVQFLQPAGSETALRVEAGVEPAAIFQDGAGDVTFTGERIVGAGPMRMRGTGTVTLGNKGLDRQPVAVVNGVLRIGAGAPGGGVLGDEGAGLTVEGFGTLDLRGGAAGLEIGKEIRFSGEGCGRRGAIVNSGAPGAGGARRLSRLRLEGCASVSGPCGWSVEKAGGRAVLTGRSNAVLTVKGPMAAGAAVRFVNADVSGLGGLAARDGGALCLAGGTALGGIAGGVSLVNGGALRFDGWQGPMSCPFASLQAAGGLNENTATATNRLESAAGGGLPVFAGTFTAGRKSVLTNASGGVCEISGTLRGPGALAGRFRLLPGAVWEMGCGASRPGAERAVFLPPVEDPLADDVKVRVDFDGGPELSRYDVCPAWGLPEGPGGLEGRVELTVRGAPAPRLTAGYSPRIEAGRLILVKEGRASLTVSSEYGMPYPAAGTHGYQAGDAAAAAVRPGTVEPAAGTRAVCTGWTGTGSAPAAGDGTNMVFTIETDSTIVWNWRTEHYVEAAAGPGGRIAAGPAPGWQEAGGVVSFTAEPDEAGMAVVWSGDTGGCAVSGAGGGVLTVPVDRPRAVSAAFRAPVPGDVELVWDGGDGAGHVWKTGGGGWLAADGTGPAVWADGATAVFTNAGPAAAVAAVAAEGVTAAAVRAEGPGAVAIGGGTLLLAGAGAGVAAAGGADVSIDARIEGADGLRVSGAGRVLLGAPACFSGPLTLEAGARLAFAGEGCLGEDGVFGGAVTNDGALVTPERWQVFGGPVAGSGRFLARGLPDGGRVRFAGELPAADTVIGTNRPLSSLPALWDVRGKTAGKEITAGREWACCFPERTEERVRVDLQFFDDRGAGDRKTKCLALEFEQTGAGLVARAIGSYWRPGGRPGEFRHDDAAGGWTAAAGAKRYGVRDAELLFGCSGALFKGPWDGWGNDGRVTAASNAVIEVDCTTGLPKKNKQHFPDKVVEAAAGGEIRFAAQVKQGGNLNSVYLRPGGVLTLEKGVTFAGWSGDQRKIVVDGGVIRFDGDVMVPEIEVLNGGTFEGAARRGILSHNKGQTVTVSGGAPLIQKAGYLLGETDATKAFTMNVGDVAEGPDMIVSGAIAGSGTTMVKTGPGMLVYSGRNSHSNCLTRIDEGILRFETDRALGTNAAITLNAGNWGTFCALDAGPCTNAAGRLGLERYGGRLILGGGQIRFAASADAAWGTNATLWIDGALGPRSVQFGRDAGGLTGEQLGRIRLSARPGDALSLDDEGWLRAPQAAAVTLTVESARGEPSPAAGQPHTYDAGAEVEASAGASPVPGGIEGTRHVCTGWAGTGSVPGTGTDTSVSFTIETDSTITWNWRTEHLLTIAAGPGGAVNAEASGWHPAGTTVDVLATPDEGYEFAGWTGDVEGEETNRPAVTVTMDGPKSLTAAFREKTAPPVPPPGPPGPPEPPPGIALPAGALVWNNGENGVWKTGGQGWLAPDGTTPVAWTNGAIAIFRGASNETAEIAADGAEASAVRVDGPGPVVIGGGTLTMSGPAEIAATNGGAAVAIDAPLAGTGGLTVFANSAPGSFVIGKPAAFSGTLAIAAGRLEFGPGGTLANDGKFGGTVTIAEGALFVAPVNKKTEQRFDKEISGGGAVLVQNPAGDFQGPVCFKNAKWTGGLTVGTNGYVKLWNGCQAGLPADGPVEVVDGGKIEVRCQQALNRTKEIRIAGPGSRLDFNNAAVSPNAKGEYLLSDGGAITLSTKNNIELFRITVTNGGTIMNIGTRTGYQKPLAFIRDAALTVRGDGVCSNSAGYALQHAKNSAAATLTLDVADGAGAAGLVISGEITGACPEKTIVKTGAGTAALSGTNNSYVCTNRIDEGTLRLETDRAMGTNAPVVLNGAAAAAAALDAGTNRNDVGTLGLGRDGGTLAIRPGGRIEFDDSRGVSWGPAGETGAVLRIAGAPGPRSIRFGTGPGGLTGEQLGKIRMNGKKKPFYLDNDGWLCLPPAPTVILIR